MLNRWCALLKSLRITPLTLAPARARRRIDSSSSASVVTSARASRNSPCQQKQRAGARGECQRIRHGEYRGRIENHHVVVLCPFLQQGGRARRQQQFGRRAWQRARGDDVDVRLCVAPQRFVELAVALNQFTQALAARQTE